MHRIVAATTTAAVNSASLSVRPVRYSVGESSVVLATVVLVSNVEIVELIAVEVVGKDVDVLVVCAAVTVLVGVRTTVADVVGAVVEVVVATVVVVDVEATVEVDVEVPVEVLVLEIGVVVARCVEADVATSTLGHEASTFVTTNLENRRIVSDVTNTTRVGGVHARCDCTRVASNLESTKRPKSPLICTGYMTFCCTANVYLGW